MYAISAAFRQAISYPSNQAVATRVDVFRDTALLASSIQVLEGQVTCDSTANVWRSASLKVIDPKGTLGPTGPTSILSPYGNELKIYRGFTYSDGKTETLPLGVFRISSVSLTDQGNRVLSLNCYDRSWTVARSRLEAPYVIAAGTNYTSAMVALLQSVYPNCPYAFASTTATTPLIVVAEMDDPWKVLSDMALSLGNQLYFDVNGVCVMRTQPNPSTDTPVWTYGDGTTSTISGVGVHYDAEPGYNEYIVEGNPPGVAPIRAAAQDNDKTSPTYYGGAYGKVPEFFSSNFITTQAQADAAALAGLLRNKGGTQLVSFSALPNPAHEGLDVVQLARAADGLTSSVFVVESFDIPLSSQPMVISCRKRSVQ